MSIEKGIPVFINSNLNSSAKALTDLLERFNAYGRMLNKQCESEVSRLVILGGFEQWNKIEEDFSHLELIRVGKQTKNFVLIGLRTLYKLSKMRILPSLLISADLYYSFLSAFVVRLFKNPKLGIQVSFHGSFSNSSDGIVKSFFRKKYLGFVVSNCQSI